MADSDMRQLQLLDAIEDAEQLYKHYLRVLRGVVGIFCVGVVLIIIGIATGVWGTQAGKNTAGLAASTIFPGVLLMLGSAGFVLTWIHKKNEYSFNDPYQQLRTARREFRNYLMLQAKNSPHTFNADGVLNDIEGYFATRNNIISRRPFK